MFEVGWTEMLVIAIVLIVVVGPKDLPRMLRTFGRTTAKLRAMAGDFRKQFDEALKEADLDDVKTMVNDARKLNPAADIRKALSPMQKAAEEVRSGLASLNEPKPSPSPEPAPTVAQPTEPAKVGPAAMPGESTPAAAVNGTPVAAAEAAPKKAATRKAAAPKAAAAKPATAKAPAAKPAAKAKAPAKARAAKPAATRGKATSDKNGAST
jgi:sec-independent protein translocase protein TatB